MRLLFSYSVILLLLFLDACKTNESGLDSSSEDLWISVNPWRNQGVCLAHLLISKGYTKEKFIQQKQAAIEKINAGIEMYWSGVHYERNREFAKLSFLEYFATLPVLPYANLMDNIFVLGHFTAIFNAVDDKLRLLSKGGREDSERFMEIADSFNRALPAYGAKLKTISGESPIAPLNFVNILFHEKNDVFAALSLAAALTFVDAAVDTTNEFPRQLWSSRIESSWLYPASKIIGLAKGDDPVGSTYHFYGMAYLNFLMGETGQLLTRSSQLYYEYIMAGVWNGKADWEDINADSGGEAFGIGLRSVLFDQASFDRTASSTYFANRCENILDRAQGQSWNPTSCDVFEIDDAASRDEAIAIANSRIKNVNNEFDYFRNDLLTATACNLHAELYSARVKSVNPQSKAKFFAWKYGEETGVFETPDLSGGSCTRTISFLKATLDTHCKESFMRAPRNNQCKTGFHCPTLEEAKKTGATFTDCGDNWINESKDHKWTCELDHF